jgi:hypothetical protein
MWPERRAGSVVKQETRPGRRCQPRTQTPSAPVMGRSPDYLNAVLVAFVQAPEFFAQGRAMFADNVQRYYRYCRGNDPFLTHAIVNPQVDRSKASAEQTEPFISSRDGRSDARRARRARREDVANHGPTADELLVYPLSGRLRPGEERYALAFDIPTDTPGLRFICREPFGSASVNFRTRYYAGDPVRTAATLYRRHDAAPLLAYIARALGQERQRRRRANRVPQSAPAHRRPALFPGRSTGRRRPKGRARSPRCDFDCNRSTPSGAKEETPCK